MKTAFITGNAGFVGFHLSQRLLARGWRVVGYDAMTDYYDVKLKQERNRILSSAPKFEFVEGFLEDEPTLAAATELAKPDVIIHLAAQAGVRHSLEAPRTYIDANLIGTFNVLEQAKTLNTPHLLMASTSSVYGSNTSMPFVEQSNTDTPLSLYAATKKANEMMAHSYAHNWKIPITMFRFFTVYGAWGRPDLALFKFVKAALADEPIDVFNYGNMARDFTYVGDLVKAIDLLIDAVPDRLNDTPFRVVNIGNGEKVPLNRFITAIEAALKIPIKRNLRPMQMGDVPETWANTDLLLNLTGYKPNTPIEAGVRSFVDWYLKYYEPDRIKTDSTRVA